MSSSTNVIVQTKLLNGRKGPSKNKSVEARFDLGDILEPTGEWSDDHKWIEVKGGETGTVWVYISYISEREPYYVVNRDYKKVKVRKWPGIGKVSGYIHRNKPVEVVRTVLGYGLTKYGWIDLYFFEEVE